MKVRLKNKGQEDPKNKSSNGKKRKLVLPKASPYTPTPKELEELNPLMLKIKKKDAEMRMQKNKERIEAYKDSLNKAYHSEYLLNKYNRLLKEHKLEDYSEGKPDFFAAGFNPFSKTKTYDNESVKSFMSDYLPYEDDLLGSGLDSEERAIYINNPFLSERGQFVNRRIALKPKQFPYPRVEVVEEDAPSTESNFKKTTKPIEKRPVEEKIKLPYKALGSDDKRDIKRRIGPSISKLSYNASGSKVFIEFSDGTKKTMTKPEFARWKKMGDNENKVQLVRKSR